ncbi:molybdopterin-dependent oxidoreductase [Streptomyces sp. CS227]|nr:molybdopterin-dependent oxidoreductase [Streptomyces sp. CS227]
MAELAGGWPEQRAEVVFDCATSGPRHHTFTGPLLRDVLLGTLPGAACAARATRKDRAGRLLVVAGADGHRAVLAWAEVDEEFRYAPVLPGGAFKVLHGAHGARHALSPHREKAQVRPVRELPPGVPRARTGHRGHRTGL